MKTLTIKLNMSDAQTMDDRGQLNSKFLTDFIRDHMGRAFLDGAPRELVYTYTFKVPDDVHKAVKLAAIEDNLTMSEYVRQMFAVYYWDNDFKAEG